MPRPLSPTQRIAKVICESDKTRPRCVMKYHPDPLRTSCNVHNCRIMSIAKKVMREINKINAEIDAPR